MFKSFGRTDQTAEKAPEKGKEQPAKEKKRLVAIYGGSFDPITNGHLNIAAEIIHLEKADEVWITPCGPRPDKPSLKTPALERWLMCHLALDTTFGSRFPIKICNEELGEPMALNSYTLMKRLEAKYPDIEFCFALGTDLVPTLNTWPPKNDTTGKSKIWEDVHFLVLPRPGYDLRERDSQTGSEDELPPWMTWLSSDGIEGVTLVTAETSSSEIRRRIKKFGDCRSQRNLTSVEGLLPSSVVAHIIRNGLYLDD